MTLRPHWNSFCAIVVLACWSLGSLLLAAEPAAQPDTGKTTAATGKKPSAGVTENAADQAAGPPVDYLRQVKPLLERQCAFCHNADEAQAGLRLDAAVLMLKGGDRGPAIVPGSPEKSLLLTAVRGSGDLLRMPKDLDPLSDSEIALLEQWIAAGAPAPADEKFEPTARKTSSHWSFQPVARVSPPATKHQAWTRNSIDPFIAARLEEQGLRPSPEADRATLIRRLSLDLHGLPPTAAEVNEFLSDDRPGAYERLVDRLLDSPRYGERWGRHWLDVARYADSNGYTIDGARSIWKYRDWVIDAINADLPFDQFTVEQLAGDLLPSASTSQVVATGFHRNTLINQEGGTDQEQFRVEAVADRVSTTGSAYLGLTLGCARCHDHKYDPISQREFYQLFAIFNNADEPNLTVATPEQAKQLKSLQEEAKLAEKSLQEYDRTAKVRQQAWEAKLADMAGEVEWTVMEPTAFQSAGGAKLELLGDRSLLVSGDVPGSDTYEVNLGIPSKTVTAVRLEALTHEQLPRTGPGLAGNGNFVLTDIGFRSAVEGAADDRLAIATAWADHSQPKFPVEHAFDNDAVQSGWAINQPADKKVNSNRTAIFVLKEALPTNSAAFIVSLRHAHANRYSLGRFRLAVASAPPAALAMPPEVLQALATVAADRTAEQKQAVLEEFRLHDVERKPLVERVDRLKASIAALQKQVPTTMVMKERATPRDTFLHIRGDFLRHGAKVAPAVPDVMHALPNDVARPNRLDFSRWLVDPANPLTPRVTANRVWQRFFGRGIVETEDDFGLQGARPTHPELLDWLATELIRQNWSLKGLNRLIVTSATYRQSSEVSEEQLKQDQFNVWLGRQNRLRMEAESIRDSALSAAGLLSDNIGGPSVYPPQPEGIYAFTQNNKNWTVSTGEDRFRRGMYTYFWRSSPDPFLMTFDAPNANVACTRRVRSNTPLQALTLANDSGFVEMAQALASRILTERPQADDRQRLTYAFQICLARVPEAHELSMLSAYLGRSRTAYAGDSAAAQAAASVPRGLNTSPAEAAAWTSVARVLLNLDEFITRE